MPTEALLADDDERLPLAAAADLQDHLLIACHDLERLQGLLAHACDVLLLSFHGANDEAEAFRGASDAASMPPALDTLVAHLGRAVTALQFQDMASQLIAHTQRRLRACADRLARDALDDDEDGAAVVEAPPLRPNPVTQDEMDAGSIELF
jgi:hypothetical protein